MSLRHISVSDKEAGELYEMLCLEIMKISEDNKFFIPVGELSRMTGLVVETLEKEGAYFPMRFEEVGFHVSSQEVSAASHELLATRQVESVKYTKDGGHGTGNSYQMTIFGDVIRDRNKEYLAELLKRSGTSLERLDAVAKDAIGTFKTIQKTKR